MDRSGSPDPIAALALHFLDFDNYASISHKSHQRNLFKYESFKLCLRISLLTILLLAAGLSLQLGRVLCCNEATGKSHKNYPHLVVISLKLTPPIQWPKVPEKR
jgi:hypothetical protein